MKIPDYLRRRSINTVLALGLLLGIATPALAPFSVSAGTITSRSIALSSSAAGATNVSYQLTFTPTTTAGSMVLEFCDDSPIVGTSCNAPTGFNASSAATTDGGTVSYVGNNVIKYVQSFTATQKQFSFTGITNPTNATVGTSGFYARIILYSGGTFGGYTNPSSIGSPSDSGGIAMAITNSVNITAAVRETMTFCVSHTAPTRGCAIVDTPTIALGHGTPVALDSSVTDTAAVVTQISTNANSGAVVSMTNNNACGGLHRAGAVSTLCDIAPTNTSNALTAGNALFGLNVATASDPTGTGSTPSGTITPLAPYSTASQYGMTYTGSNTGVTSAYGDPIFNTGGGPVSNRNQTLTFAASASNTTPAGLYSATMNLVATGTF